ncbi:MAG: hypothetical protein EPN80_10510 [Pandoraea sp.]|uniref:ShlB/FhaC/HecB family hemolysin secretion/activation protein n=1 Tax=Pandoraea sp. TaxID=1883445 RepID=UPI00122864DF|nr:ShlB/FhaC/HecB family hemolysin secretion/activation protein [Pandoraea sp.]TAL54901.1 MAG: hypothetical protein EPN80_10510 [Pandoraea sp.]TAM18330.1 MAG: hypothetical protein EPN65_06125 [Pandoraea sp.]
MKWFWLGVAGVTAFPGLAQAAGMPCFVASAAYGFTLPASQWSSASTDVPLPRQTFNSGGELGRHSIVTAPLTEVTAAPITSGGVEVTPLPQPPGASQVDGTAPDPASAASVPSPANASANAPSVLANRTALVSDCFRLEARGANRITQNIRYAITQYQPQRGSWLPTLNVRRSSVPGEGDVGWQVINERPWQFNVGLNNNGMTSTGKMEGTAGLTVNDPLGLRGLLNTTWSKDLQNAANDPTNQGLRANYIVPWSDAWTFGVSGSSVFSTDQSVPSSDNAFHSLQWRVRHVLNGSRDGQTSLLFTVTRSIDQAAGDQTTGNTYAQIGLTQRHYLGMGYVDFSLLQRVGSPLAPAAPGAGGWAYRFESLNANFSIPFY